MDIVVWLRSLGLGKYEAAFRENEIDETVLPSLTEEHLKQLGVAALGHRVKLLDAIAVLRGDTRATAPCTGAATPPAVPSASPEDRAERRQVTVMFSDLVGSTALSARMDPEDLREVISAYQTCVAETVGRLGGFIAKFMGDGVLVYFGYPHAHEDDAERAVRAGLELVAAVSALNTHAPLQTRVGIATGLVVIGDLIGSGSSQEQAIVGETPNLAARLQGIAEPNNVVIAESTQRLIGNLFELNDLGAQDLKGIGGPVGAWAALRPSSVESRFDAFHASGLTELVGREEELELLLRRWSKAKSGEGQVVLLSGEPGIGKSRLTVALLERVAAEPHTRLRYFCSPQHTDSALYPIISQMERAAGFAHNDTAQAKLDKLEALLMQSFTPQQDAALLSEMLSLPNDGRYPALELSPQRRRQKTLEALTAQVEVLSQSRPVLMIFEDVHWADPTSLEALGRTVDRLRTLGVLFIIAYRPEFEPPWIGRPYVTVLSLNRLGERDIVAMIDRVTGNKTLPESIREDIIERTDGIPLFVEEMTRAVLESDSGSEARSTAGAIPSPAPVVPPSLHASLMARLDRLGPAKEVAQIGAAIGREFSHALLAAVVGKPETELQSALDRLITAGLLFRQAVPPHATYLFKHALVQDAAYGTLLREPKRVLHVRIVEIIESQFDEIAENQPELLAYHFDEAGLAGPACDYRMRAGDRAVSRSAYKEAIAHFSAGLKLAVSLPQSADRMRRQLDFLVKLGPALMVARGMGSAEVEDACRRAAEIGETLDDRAAVFKAKWGLWLNANVRRLTTLARDRANELVILAQRSGDGDQLLEAYHCRWSTALFRGDVAATLDNSRIGVETYDMARHRHLGAAFGGHDPGVCAHVCRAIALQESGDREQAGESCAAATALAEALDHPNSLGHAFHNVGICLQLARDRDATFAAADRAVALAQKFGLIPWRAGSLLLTGWATAVGSGVTDAARLIDVEIDNATAAGPLPQYFLGLAAEVLLLAGRPADGLAHLDRAIAAIEEAGVGFYLPEIYRLRGECLLALNRRNKARARQAFVIARDVARRQGVTLFERRAAARLVEMGN
jgi:class 3 adenylate cyclase/tetratricopeptide (TPR) repeat protein